MKYRIRKSRITNIIKEVLNEENNKGCDISTNSVDNNKGLIKVKFEEDNGKTKTDADRIHIARKALRGIPESYASLGTIGKDYFTIKVTGNKFKDIEAFSAYIEKLLS